jgi:nitroreductase
MVEKEKIQIMLEAARLASHWGNVQSLNAVVIFRDEADPAVLDKIESAINGWQVKIAPVVIFWYLETDAVMDQANRLRELVKCGATGFGKIEDTLKGLEEIIIPFFEGILPSMREGMLGYIDAGQGIAQATLAAYELGLGTCCLGTQNAEGLLKELGAPESTRPLLFQTVGYPAENWEAGGQRPRLPFGQRFKMNNWATEFPRDEAVVEELKKDKMFTRPAPFAEREDELEFLKDALKLEGLGLI